MVRLKPFEMVARTILPALYVSPPRRTATAPGFTFAGVPKSCVDGAAEMIPPEPGEPRVVVAKPYAAVRSNPDSTIAHWTPARCCPLCIEFAPAMKRSPDGNSSTRPDDIYPPQPAEAGLVLLA